MTSITLTPGNVTLRQLREIYTRNLAVELSPDCHDAVHRAAGHVAKAASGDVPVYGINTGFGKLASVRIAPEKTEILQRNLILSHASGVGDPLPEKIVRLAIGIKILSLGRGASGVRLNLIETLGDMLAKGVTPIVPGQGSVGASGDLAPLAHIGAVLIGEGEALFDGERMSGGAAMKRAGILPLALIAKEGLALINGTQISTALALAALFDTHLLLQSALATGALSTDAGMGSSAPFREEVHLLRGHQAQIDAAHSLRDLMSGSEIRESHRDVDERVQDPYCLRCQPQVMGACLELLRHAGSVLAIEANAVTDNPLIAGADGEILSGGNFHAEPVAFAADQIALAIAEIGSITQRRIAMLVDPAMNSGLPAFLSPDAGLNSGFMIAEVTSAALMSENKQKAAPCSVDSTPTSANQEDHVSMACHAARRLHDMNTNLARIIAIELLTATQGVEMRGPLKTSAPLRDLVAKVRGTIPALEADRYMAPDLERAAELVTAGQVRDAVPNIVLPSLGAGA